MRKLQVHSKEFVLYLITICLINLNKKCSSLMLEMEKMEELCLKKKRLFTLSLLLSTNALSAFTKAHIVGKIGLKSDYIYTLVVVNAVLEWDLNISRLEFQNLITKWLKMCHFSAFFCSLCTIDMLNKDSLQTFFLLAYQYHFLQTYLTSLSIDVRKDSYKYNIRNFINHKTYSLGFPCRK